jgi:uncharacterized protein YeaO (DUF488 family)
MPIYAPNLNVTTSRFSNPLLGDATLLKAGIVRWPPRFPLRFELVANLYWLAPSSTMMAAARAQGRDVFAHQYIDKLEQIGAQKIVRLLGCIQGDAEGLTLLCFEDVRDGTQWCHRQLLAEWLRAHARLVVEELPDSSPPVGTKRSRKPPPDGRQLPM